MKKILIPIIALSLFCCSKKSEDPQPAPTPVDDCETNKYGKFQVKNGSNSTYNIYLNGVFKETLISKEAGKVYNVAEQLNFSLRVVQTSNCNIILGCNDQSVNYTILRCTTTVVPLQ
ncbi:MAG: hypothetical protein ACKVOU_03725 [Cytophagales bacterium]